MCVWFNNGAQASTSFTVREVKWRRCPPKCLWLNIHSEAIQGSAGYSTTTHPSSILSTCFYPAGDVLLQDDKNTFTNNKNICIYERHNSEFYIWQSTFRICVSLGSVVVMLRFITHYYCWIQISCRWEVGGKERVGRRSLGSFADSRLPLCSAGSQFLSSIFANLLVMTAMTF